MASGAGMYFEPVTAELTVSAAPHIPLVFTGVLLAMLVGERVVHAMATLLVLLVAGAAPSPRAAKADSARALLLRVLDLTIELVRAWVQALAGLFQWAVYYLLFAGIIMVVVYGCGLLQDSSPDATARFLRLWNNDGVGVSLRSLLLTPLQVLEFLFTVLVPFWNAVNYFVRGLLSTVVVPILQEGLGDVLKMVTSLEYVFRALASSLVAYVDTLQPCEGMACLTPGFRMFDFLSPALALRLIAAHFLSFARSTCELATPVFEALLYPVLDANFATSLHLALNVPLYTAVQVPLITHARCSQAANFTDARLKGIACTPDFVPVFNMAAASARHAGMLMDNWLDVVWVILLTAVGRAPPPCQPSVLAIKEVTEEQVFGGNETRIVGLGPAAFALTDGLTTQFNFIKGPTETVLARDHWPIEVAPGLGIAAVQYDEAEQVDEAGGQTLSLLGCQCYDVPDSAAEQGTRMELHCAIARYQAEDADEALDEAGLLVPVGFAVPSTAQYMTCAGTKITVDSVRWPVSRLSVPGSLGAGGRNFRAPLSAFASDKGDDGPVEVDAVIWLQPACASEGVFDPVCARTFEAAACFPYCLAARRKGSGSQGLMIYNADDWQTRVQLQGRDCAVSSVGVTLAPGQEYTSEAAPAGYGLLVEDSNDPLGRRLAQTSVFDPATLSCVASDSVMTRVNRTAIADIDERYETVLLEGQPFAVAGSAALIAVYNADGSVGVKVQRLYGEEGTESFSIVTTHSELPALPPCETLSACDQLPRDDLVSIPYAWTASPGRHNPAVETRWGVFYAVNPSLDMFSEFAKYCQGRTDYNLQIQALSSYGGIRIWRMDAFAHTEKNGEAAARGASVEMPGVFLSQTNDTSICGSAFNVIVTSMEYISEENIAVTVLHAAPAYLDMRSLKPLGNDPQRVRYRTYFLHPQTMQVRESELWQPDSATTQLRAGPSTLCPDWRNMPQFGSLLGEVGAGALLGTRMWVSLFTALPVLLQEGFLGRLRECPAVHMSHSLMLNCGKNLLSLDDSFNAFRKANTHLWMVLAKLGRLLSGLPGGETMHTFLQGMSVVQQQRFTALLRRRDFKRAAQYAANPGDYVRGRVHEYALQQYSQLQKQLSNLPDRVQKMRTQLSTRTVAFARDLLKRTKKIFTESEGLQGAQALGDGYRALFAPPPKNLWTRLPGGSFGVKAVGASVLDVSQFFWRMITRLMLELLARDATVQPLAPLVWHAFVEAKHDFREFLIKPAFRTCSGVGIMLGYSNPWARLVRESCSAAVAQQETLVTTVDIFFVMTPVLACLCRNPGNQNFETYATNVCWANAPEHLKPMIAAMIGENAARNSDMAREAVCSAMGLNVESSLRGVMDPSMDHAYKAAQALAGFVDYATVLWDPDAGRCSDLLGSPYTMAIVPEPYDYFEGCAKTQSCRSACSGPFDAFEAVRERLLDLGDQVTIEQTVVNQFFSAQEVLDGKAAPPFQVHGMLQVPVMDVSSVSGRACCNGASEQDRCVAVVGTNAQYVVQVVEYCIPSRLGIGTHEHVRWEVAGSGAWSPEIFTIAFATRELLIATFHDRVVMYRANGDAHVVMETLAPGAVAVRGQPVMHRIAWMLVAPYNFALLHGFVIRPGDATAEPVSLIVRLDGPRAWPFFFPSYTESNLDLLLFGHMATCLSEQCSDFLLLPDRQSSSIKKCFPDEGRYFFPRKLLYACIDAEIDPGLALTLGLSQNEGSTVTLTQSSSPLRKAVTLSQNALEPKDGENERRVFVSSPMATSPSWLQEVRIEWDEAANSKASASKVAAQRTKLEIMLKRQCSIDDCSGCKIPAVQRACYAASQCAVARCIGTIVNLERPLCSAGSLLQTSLELNLVKYQGIWTTISEIVILVLRLATGRASDGKELERLDMVFFALLCEAKDGIVGSMSVITSLINSISNSVDRAIKASMPPVMSQDQSAANAEAVRTMTAAATTNFLSQLSLAVLYPPIVMKKTILCHSEAFLNAVVGAGGYELSLESKEMAEATSAITGKCLSEYHKEAMKEPDSAATGGGFSEVVNEMVGDSVTAVGQVPFEAVIHTLDAGFAWAQGVVSGVMDVIATADQRHCNLPDNQADTVQTCACGDTPLMIPPSRAAEGISEGAFWCTGMMSLVNSMGETYFAYNPYTYREILAELEGSDAYLKCVSSEYADNCAHLRPGKGLPLLTLQGVSVFTVAVRCKSNYVNSQWDEGAAALFVEETSPMVKHFLGILDHIKSSRAVVEELLAPTVVLCLKTSLAEGTSNDACLQDYLTLRNKRSVGYFEYMAIPAGVTGSQHIAGCQVFTGPAQVSDGVVAGKFGACLDDADATGCTFPAMVWAGRSSNRVPVASEHAMVSEDDEDRMQVARREHVLTQERVRALLDDPKLLEWKATALDLSLFTAEGDALHQLFDAMVLGPYARAEVWPRDAERSLPTVEWFRDSGAGRTREFELPCTGDALRGVTSAPYTCGSDARRAAIRYFVRDVFFGQNEGTLKDGVEGAVQNLLNSLRTAWDIRNAATDPLDIPYGCVCEEEREADEPPRYDVACCTLSNTSAYLPVNLHATEYTKLRSESLVRELFELAGHFVERELFTRSAEPFAKHSQGSPTWDSQSRRQAAALGVLRAHKELLAYDDAEVDAPFGWLDEDHRANVSLWARCHGMLYQSLATLPIALDGVLQGLDVSTVFDPLDQGVTNFASALESFGDRVSTEAWLRSPVYWSHVMRHVPSDSLVCDSWFRTYGGDKDSNTSSNASHGGGNTSDAGSHAGDVAGSEWALNYSRIDEISSPLDAARAYVDGVDVLGSDFVLASLGWIHHEAGALGSASTGCLCGWAIDNMCYVPFEVCNDIAWVEKAGQFEEANGVADVGLEEMSSVCRNIAAGIVVVPRPGHSVAGDAVRDTVIANWRSTWWCPSMQPSATWGIYNHNATDDWLVSNDDLVGRFTVKEVLMEGRSGLRVGNMRSLLDGGWGSMISPSAQRKAPVRGQHSSGQKWCVDNIGEYFPDSFHKRWVDELFPMAQSVTESTPIATCVRVALEAAYLRMLRLGAAGTTGAQLVDALARIEAQETTMRRWRRQCLQQLDAVAMCSMRGIYDTPPSHEPTPQCPFTLTALPAHGAWVSANCILRWTDAQYFDPCQCRTCDGGSIDAAQLVSDPLCRPLPDPRLLVGEDRRDASLHWAAQFTHVSDSSAREELEALAANIAIRKTSEQLGAEVHRIIEHHLTSLSKENAFGNAVPENLWYSAEGLASESTQFCDAIHDYWPEEWDSPTGVHPTTPCGSDETAYRSFANSFSIDRRFDPPRMVYRHAALANRSLGTNHYGVVGACRTRTYGLPLQNFNNMRFCTRLDTAARADPAVPVPPKTPPVYNEGESFRFLEACGTSSEDVPWAIENDIWQTAGLILAWPDSTGTVSVWPPNEILKKAINHTAATHDGWGAQTCGLPPLQTCASDLDCESIELAAQGVNLRCLGGDDDVGVCVVTEQFGRVLQCSRHADCGENSMCDGEGKCVQPVVMFNNSLWYDLYVHVQSETCLPDERRENYGRSPWEQVPDFLRAHGLCSHRNWYEYRAVLADAGCDEGEGPKGANICPLHVDRLSRVNTQMMGEAVEQGQTIRDEGILSVKAHTCDRDFMFADGFAECLPATVIRRNGAGKRTTFSASDGDGHYGRTFATYRTRYNESIPFARLPYADNDELGFLGFHRRLQSKQEDITQRTDDVELKSCASIPHCALQEMTIRGKQVTSPRVIFPPNQPMREYTVKDAIKCGAFGFLMDTRQGSDSSCRVDPFVVPMLDIVCDHALALERIHQCSLHTGALPGQSTFLSRADMCDQLRNQYLPSDKQMIGEMVNNLPFQFKRWDSTPGSVDSLTQYFKQLTCAEGILKYLNEPRGYSYTTVDDETISSIGLYWFATPTSSDAGGLNGFSLYEIAPLWFVRCILFSSNIFFDTQAVTCPAWTRTSAGLTVSSHEWLAARAGEFDYNKLLEERNYLQSNMTQALEHLLSNLLHNYSRVVEPATTISDLFNPQCFNKIKLNFARVEEEREAENGPLLALLQSADVQARMQSKTIGDFAWDLEPACQISSCVAHEDSFINEVPGTAQDVARHLLNAFVVVNDIEIQDDLRNVDVRGVHQEQLHLFRVHAAEKQGATFLKHAQEILQNATSQCAQDTTLDEKRICLFTNAFEDPNTDVRKWVTYFDSQMYIMFSHGTHPMLKFTTPWARVGDRAVMFDVCGVDKYKEKRIAPGYGGNSQYMNTVCGIPSATPSICKSGSRDIGEDLSAFARDGYEELCNLHEAGFGGISFSGRSQKERCYDINDECLTEYLKPRDRTIDAHAVIFDEIEHDANHYNSVKLPYGVELGVKYRATGGALTHAQAKDIGKITKVNDKLKFLRQYALGDYYWSQFESFLDTVNADAGFYTRNSDFDNGLQFGGGAYNGKLLPRTSVYMSEFVDTTYGVGDEFEDVPTRQTVDLIKLGDGNNVASHVPRILSDAYEQNPRMATWTAPGLIKRLPTGDYARDKRARPIVVGHGSRPLSSSDISGSLYFEPFAEPLFEMDKRNFRGENKRIFTRQSSTLQIPLSHVHFRRMAPGYENDIGQVILRMYDEHYPSSLYLHADQLGISLGSLRYMMAVKIGCDVNSNTDCLDKAQQITVRQKIFPRTNQNGGYWNANIQQNGKPPVKHPSLMHCMTSSKLRSLQDIVFAPMHSADTPWNLLGENFDAFLRTVSNSMPDMYVSWRTIDQNDARGVRWEAERNDENLFRGGTNTDVRRTWLTRHKMFHSCSDQNCLIDSDTTLITSFGDTYDTGRLRVEDMSVVREYVQKHHHEARMLYIAANWKRLSRFWFEVYNVDNNYEAWDYYRNDKEEGWWTAALTKRKAVAYKIRLLPDFHCISDAWSLSPIDVTARGVELCGEGKVGTLVSDTVMRCAECSSVQETLCIGRHRCGPRPWIQQTENELKERFMDQEDVGVVEDVSGMDKVIAMVYAILKHGVVQATSRPTDFGAKALYRQFASQRVTAAPALAHVNSTFFNGRLGTDIPLTWPSFDAGFNPISAITYEKTTGVYDRLTGKLDAEACTSTKQTNFVNYRKCDLNQGIQWLNETTFDNSKEARGVFLPFKGRAAWTVSRKQWTGRGLLPFYEHANRNRRDTFVTWLLDDETHCKMNQADRFHSVCYVDANDQIRLFNPWLGGDYSVSDRCDATYQAGYGARVIDTRCPNSICNGEKNSQFNLEQYSSPGSECWELQGSAPTDRLVRDDQRSNLCQHLPRENSTCLHVMGTLNGLGTPIGNVYVTSDADELSMRTLSGGTEAVGETGRGGLFVSPRHAGWSGVAYAATVGSAGVLRVDDNDIAGHHVRFEIGDYGLRVDSVHLSHHLSLSDAESQSARGTEWQYFDVAYESAQASPTVQYSELWSDWACVFRQQRYLESTNEDFTPSFPDLRRAQVLFAQANEDNLVHPTQKSNTGGSSPKHRYATPNGVCRCENPDVCASLATDEAGACSFLTTVKSLHDSTWRDSELRGGTCKDQHDWPYVGGTLRDGTPLSRHLSSTCDKLDRLPSFAYRYISVPWIPAGFDTPTTMSEDGVCHTARVARDDSYEDYALCTLLHRNESFLVLECDQRILELPRDLRDLPFNVARNVLRMRRRCNQCSAPPTYHVRNGQKIAPEASIGTAFRVSTARKVSAAVRNDLSMLLCDGSLAGCSSLDAAMNTTSWSPENFWHIFFNDARQLINATWELHNTLPLNELPLDSVAEEMMSVVDKTAAIDDTALWKSPWLFCNLPSPTCEEVCDTATGICEQRCNNADNNQLQCHGSVAKEKWLDPKTRFQATTEKFSEVALQQDSLVQELNVCDLDSTLESLCRGIAAARSAVFESNCYAAGSCFRTKFVYQPSAFSLSNNEFTRSTVRAFYRFLHPNSCEEEISANHAELLAQNAELVKHCPATILQRFKEILQTARAFVGSIVRATYFLSMVIMHSLRLIVQPMVPGAQSQEIYDDIHSNIGTFWDLFVAELGDMFTMWGELFFKMIFGSGPGEWMMGLLEALCRLGEWFKDVFYYGLFCPLYQGYGDVMGWIGDNLSWLFDTTFFKEEAIRARENACTGQDADECSMFTQNPDALIPRVDVATRCWSQYVNTLGDANSLSCSASDSCLMSDGKTLVACDDCPFVQLQDFQRYGCDSVRKQCRCGVQLVTRSSCINHAQCVLDTSSTCEMLDDAFSPLSFGTTPCNDCVTSEAICVDAPGGARCACSIRPEAYANCPANEIGKSVVPDPLSLCLVAKSATLVSSLSSSTAYTVNLAELAAAPCAMVDITRTFCYTVYSNAFQYAPMIVALGTLPVSNAQRRLLEANEQRPTRNAESELTGQLHIGPADLERARSAPWHRVKDEVCHALFATNYTLSAVSDIVSQRQCIRWRAVGYDTLRAFNITSIPDTFLLGFADISHAIMEHDLLHELIKHPHLPLYAIMHSEYARPLRAAIRYTRRALHYGLGMLKHHGEWLGMKRSSNFTKTTYLRSNMTSYVHTSASLLSEFMAGVPQPALTSSVKQLIESFNTTIEQNLNTRHLLEFQDTVDAVQAYSTKVALGDGATQILGVNVEAAYALPTQFPPITLIWNQAANCFAVEALFNLCYTTADLLVRYFSNNRPVTPSASTHITTPFTDAFNEGAYAGIIGAEPRSFVERTARWISEDILRLPRGAVRRWFAALPEWIYDFFVCNVDTVMFCSKLQYSLLTGGVFVLSAMFVLGMLASSVGIPFVWTGIAVAYLPVTLFFCLGVSPFCFPMVPTCFGELFIDLFDTIIPSRIHLPLALQTSPGCIDTNVTGDLCVVPCSAAPFGFVGWQQPLAWSICEVGLCPDFHNTVREWPLFHTDGDLFYEFTAALYRSNLILRDADEDVRTAFRYCASINSFRILPLGLLLGAIAYVVPALLTLPLQFTLGTLQLVLASVPLLHTRVAED